MVSVKHFDASDPYILCTVFMPELTIVRAQPKPGAGEENGKIKRF
jgi:hypothetical protein